MSTHEIFKKIEETAERHLRDEQKMDVDMAFSDGTIIRRKGDGAEIMENLKSIIALADTEGLCNQSPDPGCCS